MKKFSKIILASAVILAIAVIVLLYFHPSPPAPNIPNVKIDYSKQYSNVVSDQAGFEMEKSGKNFIIYYHSGDEANANKSLAVVEQAGAGLYEKYLGLKPNGISIYLAITAEEYARIADFPGGMKNVKVGAASAPNGNMYLYKPFDDVSGNTASIIVHEGTHAVVYRFLGREGMGNLPGFLNEGLAHFMEYTFRYGENFQPLKQMDTDLWAKVIKTGSPAFMTLDELARNCQGYISDGEKDALCRSQGTFVVWYVIKNYGQDAWIRFLIDLKQNKDWQKSLETVSGKNLNQLDQEIQGQLKL